MTWMLASLYCKETYILRNAHHPYVDDILIAAMPDELEALQQALSAIFPISDWEEDTFDYIGSQVEQRDGKILISQENYVDSRLETIEIPKGVVMDEFR